MKKVLLGTSALAVAALIGGTAAAAEAPKMTISGALEYHVRSISDDADRSASFDIASQQYWSEIVFKGTGKTDGGMTYGAEVQWRPINMSIDEAFLTFGDSWGTLVLGDEDGPLSAGEIFGFDYLPIGGADAGPYGVSFAGPSGLVAESEDATKIRYQTPSMGGVKLTVSYTPDNSAGFGSGSSATDASAGNTFVDVLEAGVNYGGTFGSVSVDAHVGAVLAGDVGGAGGDAFEGPDGMQAGVKVGMSGFTFAVGYADRGKAGLAKGTTDDNGSFIDAAAVYSMDALSVGLGYHMGTENDVDSTGTYLEVGYGIADGLWTFAGVSMSEEDGGADATSVVIGSRITF